MWKLILVGALLALVLVALAIHHWRADFPRRELSETVGSVHQGFRLSEALRREVAEKPVLVAVLVDLALGEAGQRVAELTYVYEDATARGQEVSVLHVDIRNDTGIAEVDLRSEGEAPAGSGGPPGPHPPLDLDVVSLDIDQALVVAAREGGRELLASQVLEDVQLDMVLGVTSGVPTWSVHYDAWGRNGPGGFLGVDLDARDGTVIDVTRHAARGLPE